MLEISKARKKVEKVNGASGTCGIPLNKPTDTLMESHKKGERRRQREYTKTQ